MSIQLIGCDEHVPVNVEVRPANGVIVKFIVEYERMTRQDIRDYTKRSYERQKEIVDLSTKLQKSLEYEATLKITTDEDEIAELNEKLEEMGTSESIKDGITVINQEADEDLKARIKGWKGLKGADKKTIKFSKEALDAMMDSQIYFEALDNGQWQATGGLIKN